MVDQIHIDEDPRFRSDAPDGYRPPEGAIDGIWDERGRPRPACDQLCRFLAEIGVDGLERIQRDADLSLLNQGITFTVYADDRGSEKIFPLDLIPRIITPDRWALIESGVRQRLAALNLFLADLYGEQRILREQIVPTDLVLGSPDYCRAMRDLAVPNGVYVHVAGTDLIEGEGGELMILEDNVRVPSGVSYVLENRIVLSRVMPELLEAHRVRPVDQYPEMLLAALTAASPRPNPVVAVLTPGIFNSAYYEHAYLAAQMGVELVEGRDLTVDEDVVYMKNTSGLKRIDVIYRRIDDHFLDPLAFRSDSTLGVPGLMNAYRAGNVVLANAPGTGVVDDKAMYAYMPKAIRFYLGEEPILSQVPTYLGRDPTDRKFILENLESLVVKPTDGAGGYGLLIGPAATAEEISQMRSAIRLQGHRFVAQPVQSLSTLPTLVGDQERHVAPRHVDLRPFAISRAPERVDVLPGGLTRVALRKGSLVVNSSQGGGSKDTWVLQEDLRRPSGPRC
jgi:uncharacterized circularly permuted ATP-grasp superfamily protein